MQSSNMFYNFSAIYLSQFTGETMKKGKVLVFARYRSGSSMTQSFFIKNPNSFSLFEPCKLKAPPAVGVPGDRAIMKVGGRELHTPSLQ